MSSIWNEMILSYNLTSSALSLSVLVMSLFGFSDGVIRLHMNEKSPIRKRYEVPPGDVVLERSHDLRP